MINHRMIKDLLGEYPFMLDIYWQLMAKNRPWSEHYNLNGLAPVLSQAIIDAKIARENAPRGKRIFLFASLHYWIEETMMIGVALAGMGHDVTFGYLPFADWKEPMSKYDIRKQDLYSKDILSQAESIMKIVSFVNVKAIQTLKTPQLEQIAEDVAIFDTQYTLQVEEIEKTNSLYQFRYERNLQAARSLYTWLATNKPDIVIVPNGTIQEMGVLYQVSRLMDFKTITFEFGDQKERIWLAQNSEIMRQDTDDLWHELGRNPITEEHHQTLIDLYAARKNARLWRNFARQWQEIPTGGANELREKLSLDERPIVMLATNVLGDSLTLGRQVISNTMAEWILSTLQVLIKREDIQLIIRIHPGEMLTSGTSMVEVINSTYPNLPDFVHLIRPEDKTNTYDLIEITDIGLVYTTTVGLEMAMAGIPVIVAGQTHYKGRGFTHDPDTWDEYLNLLGKILLDHKNYRLKEKAVELAWRYAYLFFFEFPLVFPWHLVYFKEDIKNRSVAFVLSDKGQKKYGEAFRYLIGEEIDYSFRNKNLG